MMIEDKNLNLAVKVKSVEAKKSQQSVAPKTQSNPFGKVNVLEFIGSVKAEFKKITWTSPEELRVYTKIVVGATFFLGMGIYGVDLFIQGILSGLGALVSWMS